MISSRNNHLVVGKRAILVRDVVNSVCDRQTIEFITKRFPVDLLEIWECIDALADIEEQAKKGSFPNLDKVPGTFKGCE